MNNTAARWLTAAFLPRRKMKRMLTCLIFLTVLLIVYIVVEPRKNKEIPEEIPDRKDFNFSLMLPFMEPKLSIDERSLFMAVIVNTAASGFKHRTLRTAIRNTWGHVSSKAFDRNKAWRLFFVLGLTNKHDDKQNRIESFQNNDIIIGNFTDHYYNIATKTFMGHYWVFTRLKCVYVLKTDDDVYVRVPQTIQWLHDQGSPRPFYGGYVERIKLDVIHDVTNKWYITPKQYDGDLWPPYCHGAFHVLSNDAIPIIVNSSRQRNPPFTDDAYIAVLMHNASIAATPIPGYYLFRNYKYDCDLLTVKATGHKLSATDIMKYYSFYQTYNKDDIQWKCSYRIYRKFISKYLPIL